MSRGTKPALYSQILFTEAAVNRRIREMAIKIISNNASGNTLFVGLLNGSLPFATKLMSAIQKADPRYHPNIQFMIISRYGSSHRGGKPRLITDLPPDYRHLNGLNVVLVDDLIDGGDTLDFARNLLHKYGAKTVKAVVLVKKLKQPAVETKIELYGFMAPDKWLTGMGMDDRGRGLEANRWAGWIALA